MRAGHLLFDWSRDRLGGACEVHPTTSRRYEKGAVPPKARTFAAIRAALEAAGVEFIPENGGGVEVRMRKPDA